MRVATLRILSRASDLARLQAFLVGRAFETRFPDIEVSYLTRVAAGDRDVATPLTALVDKGAFTSDLSEVLTTGDADAVVHSWKDLPLEERAGTSVVATLERADPRDVLLVRREVATRQPAVLNILSSSPRRAWLLEQSLPALLPWRVETLRFAPVRGNIHTRLTRLMEGRGDALVVAKAAVDRLLGFGGEFSHAAAALREILAQCRWMVLPVREVPGAPAQGALAVEVSSHSAWADRVRAISHEPTWQAVRHERDVLASYGGGCHQALGATVLPREYGLVVSVRGHAEGGRMDERWALVGSSTMPPAVGEQRIWPRPDERRQATRRALDPAQPAADAGYWIARTEALPRTWTVGLEQLIWTAGSTTWRGLAARGVWVHGCADGLGDEEPPSIEALAGRPLAWHRLTHAAAASDDCGAVATYVVDDPLPDDLPMRTHFFWTSGTQFKAAVARWPAVRDGWHGSGPGRTRRTIQTVLGASGRTGVWLDYEQWHRDVLKK